MALAFKLADDESLLDESYNRKIIKNDEVIYFLVLTYIVVVGLRILFSVSVASRLLVPLGRPRSLLQR